MVPTSIGGHAGDLARFSPAIRFGWVTRIRRGRGLDGGAAAQWRCDVECTDGGDAPNCLVIGPRLPHVHTDEQPAFGLVGTFGANRLDPWFLPLVWGAATLEQIRANVALDVFQTVTFRVADDGSYFVEVPTPDGGAEKRLEISGPQALFLMLGGTRRLARAGTVDGSEAGDYVAIDAASSPTFVAWMQWVTAALNALLAVAQAGGGPIPNGQGNAALTPFVLTGPDGAPAGDTVPEVEGQGGEAPAAAQVVGRIVTGSSTVRGK